VTLKLGQVIERIGPAEFAGVDQAHEHIPDVGAMASLVEQRILAMENRLLQGPLTDIIVQGRPGHAQEERQLHPVFQQIGDGPA
jgi:hypothetical protein